MEILDTMDTASFKMAFTRFQSIRGVCNYLRSDAGSNFMGARNEEVEITEETITTTKNMWEQQGKTWDVNPLSLPISVVYGNEPSGKFGK